jgi:signal transduction histidine kinase
MSPRRAVIVRTLVTGIGLPAVAFVLQKLVWPFIPPSPHLLFYPAVILAARSAGTVAGIVATAVSVLSIAIGFLPPAVSLRIDGPRDVLNLTIFSFVSIVLSVTIGRLRMTLRREHAARIAADETWAMIAHDLRTPLGTIQMAAGQLTTRLSRAGGDLERAARIIERSSDRALHLLRDAVDTVKLGEGAFVVTPEACDVRELFAHVADAAQAAAVRSGVKLDTDVATKRAVICDEPRVAQVLDNLVSNALRYTPRGGAVTIVADDAGDGVRIRVKDTGQGIPSGDLKSIFDKHWSGRGSSGLGLWIARSIVRAHGSELEVRSKEGAGTEFAFVLRSADDDRVRSLRERVALGLT